jgi:catechol 2,3-dioxygenase-like lactoylglutathione lyase family enzyme
MLNPNYLLLYVDSPKASGAFYGDLLGLTPVEAQATFVLFVLPSGLKLGLWSRYTVEPAAAPMGTPVGGGGELCFTVADRDAVRATYQSWGDKGLRIMQAPVAMDFGFTFVALDSDGHRLRVFCREDN